MMKEREILDLKARWETQLTAIADGTDADSLKWKWNDKRRQEEWFYWTGKVWTLDLVLELPYVQGYVCVGDRIPFQPRKDAHAI
jgi:hypothetical protein